MSLNDPKTFINRISSWNSTDHIPTQSFLDKSIILLRWYVSNSQVNKADEASINHIFTTIKQQKTRTRHSLNPRVEADYVVAIWKYDWRSGAGGLESISSIYCSHIASGREGIGN